MHNTQQTYTFSKNPKFNETMQAGKTVRFLRTCKLWQIVRFIVLNIKMTLVVLKGH